MFFQANIAGSHKQNQNPMQTIKQGVPPPTDWFKLSTDASRLKNIKLTTTICVCRIDRGTIHHI